MKDTLEFLVPFALIVAAIWFAAHILSATGVADIIGTLIYYAILALLVGCLGLLAYGSLIKAFGKGSGQ